LGRIPESVIDEVLAKADIVDVVGNYVSLKPRGGNMWGLCPFHDEKTPSFSVNPAKGIYWCFGACQKGGNAIKFIMEIEHLNYREAIIFLADKYGVTIPDDRYTNNAAEEKLKKRKARVNQILNEAQAYFKSSFNDERIAARARKYAEERGLDKATIDHFGIGYAPDGWDNLYRLLKSKGYTDEEMMDSGIFSKSKKGSVIDMFRDRLMFPIYDSTGDIIAFGGRALDTKYPRTPKYINSPDSLVYKKQDHFYALNFARKEKPNSLIVVEGYMDAIAMHRAGFRNTVASLGTAFTETHLKICSRIAKEVIFFFDADNAGQQAALRAIRLMTGYLRKLSGIDLRIKIAKVPEAKDPDAFIKEHGVQAFKEVVDNALYVDEYLLERAYNDNYTEEKGLDKGKYQEDVCTYASWLNDEIKRSSMAITAASYLGASSEAVFNRINALRDANIRNEGASKERSIARERQEELSNRNAAVPEEIEGAPAADVTEPSADVPEVHEVNDSASIEEINLFAYALALGDSLVDEKILARTDILRPADFTGDTMKELVSDLLAILDRTGDVTFARMTDCFSRVTINGLEAENVMFAPFDKADSEKNIEVKRDMYLNYLYKIRIAVCDKEEKRILALYSGATEEERTILQKNLTVISEYKAKMIDALGVL
jgi:DNA primase catalytic core